MQKVQKKIENAFILYFIYSTLSLCFTTLSYLHRTRFTKNENVFFLLFGKIATAFIFMRNFAHSKNMTSKKKFAKLHQKNVGD